MSVFENAWLRKHGAGPLGHVGYWVAGLAVAALAYALYTTSMRAGESATRTDETLEALRAIELINGSMGRAESSQFAFLLSGEDRHLAERDAMLGEIPAYIAKLRPVVSATPLQLERLGAIGNLIEERTGRMHEMASLRRAGRLDAASAAEAANIGQAITGRIYSLGEQMRTSEMQFLERDRASEARDEASLRQTLGLLVAASVLFMLPSYAGFILQGRARRRLEARLLDMAESLPGAVYQIRRTPDGRLRYEFMTSATESVRGVNREKALADASIAFDSIVEEDRDRYFEAVLASALTLAPIDLTYRIVDQDGHERWVHSSASPQRAPDGSTLWNGIWTDVTGQKLMERALIEAKETADMANRAKSTFLATMSHEIRTPMNGMLGMLELLSLTRLDPKQKTTLEVVRESGRTLLRLIDEILDFSKIEAGKLEVAPEVASIRKVVDSVFRSFSGAASSKGILLKRTIDPRVSPAVRVDQLRLRQILGNLVSNSIKFTSTGSVEIRVELQEHRDQHDVLRISVVDTGMGIAPERQAHLFEPYSQVSGDTTRQYGGTGLGLAICKRLVQLMGGSIEFESAPGKGTSVAFCLALPVVDPAELPVEPDDSKLKIERIGLQRAPPSVAQAQAEGTLVLVADDHSINRMLLVRQLAALGYACESVENGVEALEKWRTGRFAMILSDCNMPEMDGYELARRIRECEPELGPRTTLVACTANALRDDARKCFEAGMDDYLPKPVELFQLWKILQRWVTAPGVPSEPSSAEAARAEALDSPVDRSILEEYSGGNEGTERALMGHYRRVNERDTERLMEAISRSDLIHATESLHRMKGASSAIGAIAVARVCGKLEDASRANDLETVISHLDELRTEIGRLNAYLDALGA